MTWDECAETCAEKEAGMLCIESETHNNYVTSIIDDAPCWMGYHESDLDGTWEGPVGCESNYSNWGEAQPLDPTGNGEPGYAYLR